MNARALAVAAACLLGVGAGTAPGLAADRTYRMDFAWEAIDDATADFLFGRIEDVLVGPDNTVFILDAQLREVQVFSPEGEHAGTLGGQGNGPGEFQAVGWLCGMPDGSLGVGSKQLARIAKFDMADGRFRGDFLGAGRDDPVAMFGGANSPSLGTDNRLVAFVHEIRQGGGLWNPRMYLAVFEDRNLPGRESPLREIAEVGAPNGRDVEEEDFYWLWKPWTIDSMNRIVMAPYWTEFRLRYYDLDGKLLAEKEFPFQHRARTEDELKRLPNMMWGGRGSEAVGIEQVLAKHEAVVRAVYPRPEGGVWVRTNRAGEEAGKGVFMVLEAVSAEGDHEGKVRLVGPGDESLDRLAFGANGRIVVVHGAERFVRTARGAHKSDDVPELRVVAYDLVEVAP